MAPYRRVRWCAIALLLPLLNACGVMPSSLINPVSSDPKQEAVDLLKSFESGDTRAQGAIDPDKYIQHNLGVADGIEGLRTLLAARPPGSTTVQTVRVFRDQDFVFTQTEYNFSGRQMVGFDVFRFEKGKIVEHWDNLEAESATANPSGHSMLDGPANVSDRDRTNANKALMQAYMDDLLADRRDRIVEYFNGDSYIQHNPYVGDGLKNLAAGLVELAQRGQAVHIAHVERVLAEGNFVLVMSEGTLGDKPFGFYDLYRIDNYKIVEHWDTIQAIPPKSAWKNKNGKF